MGQDELGALKDILVLIDPAFRILLGLVTGFFLMELGKWLLKTEKDGAASLYTFFLSSLTAFLLWALIGGILPIINSCLLGFILGAGLHIIFRGLDFEENQQFSVNYKEYISSPFKKKK